MPPQALKSLFRGKNWHFVQYPRQSMLYFLSGLLGLFCSVALVFLPAVAHAEVWGYVDSRGIAHFAAEKVDQRYELFFKDSPSAASGVPAGTKEVFADYARPVVAPRAPHKLIAFFEVSTNFKAVQHLMRQAGKQHNIDFELLKALIVTESGFDPLAVSPKGAVGLMQLMPPTAQRYGVRGDAKLSTEKKLLDPKVNIAAGTAYLRDLVNLFPGRLDLVLAAYNAGEGAVQRAGNQVPNYKETQNYVKTVMQMYSHLKPPEQLVALSQAPQAPQAATSAPEGTAVPRMGGALGRGNMVVPLVALPTPIAKP